MANQLWCIDFLTPTTPFIIPHRLPAFLESLMPLTNCCSIHARSDFSRVYSNSCCSCLFEPEIIKVGQSSHKMYSNNILNFQESTPILNACAKMSRNILNAPRLTHSWLEEIMKQKFDVTEHVSYHMQKVYNVITQQTPAEELLAKQEVRRYN